MTMTRNDLTTQERILFKMYNAIAICDLDLDKLGDEDIIEFSEYFMNHVNMPSVYKHELPLSKKIYPVYDSLSNDDRDKFNDIIYQNTEYRNEFFYNSQDLELSHEQMMKMTDEEITAYLKEHDGIYENHTYTIAEERLLSNVIDLFSMIIEETDPSGLDDTIKEEYIENVLGQIRHFIRF